MLAVALTLALAGIGLAWRDRVPLGAARLDTDVAGAVLLGILVVGVVAYAVALVLVGSGARRPRREAPTWMQLLARLVALVLLVVVFREVIDRVPLGDWTRSGQPNEPPSPAGEESGDDTGSSPWTQPLSIVLLTVLLALVVVGLAVLRRVVPAEPPDEPGTTPAETARTLADAVAAGRRALEELDDDRAAVIACYEAMQSTLERRGVRGHGADTATDLMHRAVRLGVVRGPAASRLAQLFGLARFSAAALPPDAASQARQALLQVEAEVGAAVDR